MRLAVLTTIWACACLALAGAGCDSDDGGNTTTTDTAADATSGADTTGGADSTEGADTAEDNIRDLVFDDATFEQRKEYMQKVFAPEMKALFQAFDETAYADFNCATCHGASAPEGTFQMPNVAYAIDLANFPSRDSDDPREAAYTAFMQDTVLPTAAALLKRQPFDPSTGTGFGCLGCHPTAQ